MMIVVSIIGLSLLIIGHEFGHFVAARRLGMKVEEFGIGFPPRMLARKHGETEYSINWLPLGGFVRIAGEQRGSDREASAETERLFWAQAPWRRMIVTFAGVFMNLALGWIFFSMVFMIGTDPAVLVSGVENGSPADAAGMKSGDVIIGFEGNDDFISFVRSHSGEEIDLKVVRGTKEVMIHATPRIEVPAGEGALGVLVEEVGVQRTGFFNALWKGFESSLLVIQGTVLALYALVKNLILNASLLKGVVGPVGIISVALGAGKLGIAYFLQILAIISVNLAVLNLVPFPALDGGRFLMILIEKIKGSPVSRTVEGVINGAGFALLIVLMILVTVRDVTQLGS